MPRYCFGFTFLVNFLILCFFSQIAWADSAGSDSTDGNSNAVDTSKLSVPSSEIPTSAASTITPQQTGIVQFNNSGYSNLSYPNCGGICGFGIVRLTPSNNGNVSPEAVMGVVMQFDSPEKRNAQAQQNYFKAQQNLSKAQSDRFAL